MEELVEEVTEVLASRFPGHIELEETVPGQKVGGSLISAVFVGMSQTDRQQAVRAALQEGLPSVADFLSVGLILTLTPQEVASMQGAMAAA